MRIFVDMDGTLAHWNSNLPYYEKLYEKGYFLNLKPMEQVLSNVKDLIEEGFDVYILSSYLVDSEYALQEKNDWLDIHLKELDVCKRIFVRYGDDKSTYIKNGINANDYLIDDYTHNLLYWKEAGGTGVKLLNGINHTNETWQDDVLDGITGMGILTFFHQEKKAASLFFDEMEDAGQQQM